MELLHRNYIKEEKNVQLFKLCKPLLKIFNKTKNYQKTREVNNHPNKQKKGKLQDNKNDRGIS